MGYSTNNYSIKCLPLFEICFLQQQISADFKMMEIKSLYDIKLRSLFKRFCETCKQYLKTEFLLEDYNEKMDVMKLLVTDAISIYNTKRPHLSFQMKTPYEMHSQREIETYKKSSSLKAILQR